MLKACLSVICFVSVASASGSSNVVDSVGCLVKKRPKRCGFCGLVNPHVVCVCEEMHKKISIALIGNDVIIWVSRDRLIIAFYLSTSRWVEYSPVQLFCAKMGTRETKNLADKLCTVFSKEV